MSHGVTENTAGLAYTGDAGGLNEATSDIFGTAVEFYANNASDPGDYLIGEEININGNGTPLRYMDKPSKDGASKDCWSSSTRRPGPALLLRPAEPLVLPGLRGLGRQDHQRRVVQQPHLQRLHGDRHRPGQGREDLVPHALDLPDLRQQLRGRPRRRDQVRQGPVRRLQRRVHRASPPRSPRSRSRPARRPAWRHDAAAHRQQPAGQPRASSPARSAGPAPPGRSPTTPAARPTPAAGRPGSAATARPRPRTSPSRWPSRPPPPRRRCRSGCAPTPPRAGSTAYDTMKVQVVSGTTTTTLATYSNVGANATYAQKSFSLSAYKGKTITVKFLDERGRLAADQLRRRRHLGDHRLTAARTPRQRRPCGVGAVVVCGKGCGGAVRSGRTARAPAFGPEESTTRLLSGCFSGARPGSSSRAGPLLAPLLTSRTMSSGYLALPLEGVRRLHGTPPTARRISLRISGLTWQVLSWPRLLICRLPSACRTSVSLKPAMPPLRVTVIGNAAAGFGVEGDGAAAARARRGAGPLAGTPRATRARPARRQREGERARHHDPHQLSCPSAVHVRRLLRVRVRSAVPGVRRRAGPRRSLRGEIGPMPRTRVRRAPAGRARLRADDFLSMTLR